MDTPPEAQKLPKCRLFFILTIILILSLVLLAGYCAWLFVLYETDVEQMEHSDESFMKNPTESPIEDAIHFSTSLPEADKDYLIKSVNTDLEGSFSEDEGGDFGFLGSSSSVESVYDSSLPYGSSETSVSLSLSWPEVYEYSYSDSSSLSVDDTTKKADQFLIPDRKGKLRSGGLKGFLDNLRNNGGRDTTVEDVLSYDVMSSYWIRHPIDDDVEESQSITAFDSDFTEWSDWVEPSDEGSGSWQEDDSWFSSDWPIDLFSETLSEVDSYVGSGDSYDIVVSMTFILSFIRLFTDFIRTFLNTFDTDLPLSRLPKLRVTVNVNWQNSNHSFIRSFLPSHIRPFVRSSVRLFVRPLIHFVTDSLYQDCPKYLKGFFCKFPVSRKPFLLSVSMNIIVVYDLNQG